MTKKVKVTLRTNGFTSNYMVERVTNTLRWTPGQQLNKQQAEEMMKAPNVEVTVVVR